MSRAGEAAARTQGSQVKHLLLFPLVAFALGAACWACKGDPFLDQGIECIASAKAMVDAGSQERRAAAEACIRKLEDGGHADAQSHLDVGASRDAGGGGIRSTDGGSHG